MKASNDEAKIAVKRAKVYRMIQQAAELAEAGHNDEADAVAEVVSREIGFDIRLPSQLSDQENIDRVNAVIDAMADQPGGAATTFGDEPFIGIKARAALGSLQHLAKKDPAFDVDEVISYIPTNMGLAILTAAFSLIAQTLP